MLTVLLACCLVTDASHDRWTVYDERGRREAEVRQSSPGRYDVYDAKGNRLGWGQRSPIDGRIQFYDRRGNRTIHVVPGASQRR